MNKPKYVYVASSWRNNIQVAVVHALRAAGIPCYDFKNPEGGTGFHWSEVMPSFNSGDQLADADEYIKALEHPRSVEGFRSDYDAMERADAFVLVLPCGRSAHLEAGWAMGMKKPTFILLDGALHPNNMVTPELMYKMVETCGGGISDSLFDLLGQLRVED